MRRTEWKERRKEVASKAGSIDKTVLMQQYIEDKTRSNFSSLDGKQANTNWQQDFATLMLSHASDIKTDRSKLFSALLHEYPVRDDGIRTKNELAQLLGVPRVTLSKWIDRDSFYLSVNQIEDATRYMLSLAAQNKLEVFTFDGTLHSFWLGTEIEDFHAPVFLNAFINLFLQLPLRERRVFLTQYRDFDKQYDSVSVQELFRDRLNEQQFYNGKSILNVMPSLSRNVQQFMICFVSGDKSDDLKKALNRIDIREIMTISYILRLPLDYFICADYAERLLDKIVFEHADGSEFRITPDNFDYAVLKDACKFLMTKRRLVQEEIVCDLTLKLKDLDLR